jgi:hypothetical protein
LQARFASSAVKKSAFAEGKPTSTLIVNNHQKKKPTQKTFD